jgi:hypothetical protein
MKVIMVMFAMAVLLLAGCRYESPFTTEHRIAIDSAVLGLWEPKPDGDAEDPEQDELMMILKYSNTEYLIHYPTGKDGIYYRGYPIQIGGMSCVQLQVIGANDGPPEKDETKLFYAVSYELTEGELQIKTLNTDLVKDDLKTTEELRKAFLTHKDNKDLFKDLGVFRKKR